MLLSKSHFLSWKILSRVDDFSLIRFNNIPTSQQANQPTNKPTSTAEDNWKGAYMAT